MRRCTRLPVELGAEVCTTEWALLPAVIVYWRDRQCWMVTAHFLCVAAWVGSQA